MIHIRTKDEIARMREAGIIAANVRTLVGKSVAPGVTTKEMDTLVRDYIYQHGATPSFYHYNGYPGNICVSINEEIVHGIPGKRVIQDGDIVSIDIGVHYKGYHADTADTFFAGEVSQEARRLVEVTRQSFYAALPFCKPHQTLGDIGHAVQSVAEENGYSVVRMLTGHGVGKNLHEDPEVLNYGKPGRGGVLKAGMVIAVEPMVNAGTHRIKTLSDGWTCITADGALSAHYEHTIAITEDGPQILTALDVEDESGGK